MLRLRIGKMRQQSAEFVCLLLCIFFICGEARPRIFRRRDVSRAEMIERLSLLQRKILQDQHTPIWAESKNEDVQETVKQVEQNKWEPKAEEKKEWIKETKEDKVAVRHEPKADRDQTKVEENNDSWHQEIREEMGQIRREEESEDAWHQERQARQTKVEEKDPWNPDEEWKVERNMAEKVEPKAHKKSGNSNWEENSVARVKDEEWKEAKVEEEKVELRKQIPIDEKKEEPKVEERMEDPQVEKPNANIKDKAKVEERKASMVEDRKEEPMIESMKELTTVEEKTLEPNLDDKKKENPEARGESKLGETIERKVEDKKREKKVNEEALKVQDKKEEKAQHGLKYEDKKEKEGNPSASSEIYEDKPVESEIQEDPHSDLDADYPNFLDELRNFPERFQKTAESVKDHIRYSSLDRYSTHSKELFIQANQQIQESFTPLLGKDYAPFLAYFVSYGLLLLPLALVTYLLDRIRARYSLQKILLFVNIYLSAYFAALLAVALVLDSEPMKFLMKYSSSSYIFLQLLQGFGYVMYLLLNIAELISTCSNGRIAAKFSSLLQWVVVVAVGFHYYVTVFHRAMARKGPLTGWKMYGLYSIAFVFLCLFARIDRGKKHYVAVEVDDTTDKKN